MDVVGVGALNLDLIANWEEIALDDRDEILSLFSVDRERITQNLDGLLRAVTSIRRSGILRTERGGSAFNTLQALGSMRLGLRLGYVGVAAASPQRLTEILGVHGLPSAREALAGAGIDQGGVLDGAPPGGVSISIVRGPIRSLRTLYDPQISSVLRPHIEQLQAYLRRARHIHVTSIFGPGAESFVADLIESVMNDSGAPTLSVDPGETWARMAGSSRENMSDVARLLRLADVIFVNREELACLAGSGDSEGPLAVLERYSGRSGKTKFLLLKSVTDARSFALLAGRVIEDRLPQRVLPSSRIADSTGAGDVFAAGVLAGLHSDRERIIAGMGLGLAASRHKIQYVGSAGYKDLDRVIAGFWDTSSSL